MIQCRHVLASEHSAAHARDVAGCMLGLIYALRGQSARARPLLLDALALARRIELVAIELLSTWGLALVEEQNGANAAAADYCHAILSRWEGIEDRHYAITPLRWSVTFLAAGCNDAEARAVANALARIASDTAQPEALSALAHALGEVALLDGQPAQAAGLFRQSHQLLQEVEIPYCYALTGYRAAVACAAANELQTAGEYQANALRVARKLGARPLANRIAGILSASDATATPAGRGQLAGAGRSTSRILTGRQLEILRLVALGNTTAQIAKVLFLSPRTVEMHIGNIYTALDCRTRAEAVRMALGLGLLTE